MVAFTAQQLATRKALYEGEWLIQNPDFRERPATIEEFLGPDYLNIASGVRPGVKECLVEIFGEEPNVFSIAEVEAAMYTGGIGVGKTTFASIALPYMVHWCLCLKDPQGFLELLPGSRIAFMMMSTSEKQAKEVLFGDIFARIKHSVWFKDYPYDPKFTSQIRFPNDIWIVPGDSSDTTFEGYNILAGVIDEMDSHKVTEKKDYAEDGYNTIRNRITSRFGNRGLLILIGQMKNSTGFASRKYQEFVDAGKDGSRYAMKLTIWDSLGWQKFLKPNGDRDSFYFDLKRKCIIDEALALFINDPSIVMEIPRVYKKDFEGNPQQALRDHAGIPPMVGDNFIGMVDKVEACGDAWLARYGDIGSPVGTTLNIPEFAEWFVAKDTLPRAVHVDISYSAAGDAMGIAMGHVPELKYVDGGDKPESKPVIVFDCLIRIRPAPGRQIQLSQMREIIYYLNDDRGFNIKSVTFDGFQSTDSIQQMRRRGYKTGYVSMDRDLLPYHDLREAIYEARCEWPKYMTIIRNGDSKLVEIAVQELLQLVDTGRKIDHPAGGSKDLTDAMAGVVYKLMGDRKFRKGLSASTASIAVAGSGSFFDPSSSGYGSQARQGVPDLSRMGDSFRNPPSTSIGNLGSFLMPVPPRLRRDNEA